MGHYCCIIVSTAVTIVGAGLINPLPPPKTDPALPKVLSYVNRRGYIDTEGQLANLRATPPQALDNNTDNALTYPPVAAKASENVWHP